MKWIAYCKVKKAGKYGKRKAEGELGVKGLGGGRLGQHIFNVGFWILNFSRGCGPDACAG